MTIPGVGPVIATALVATVGEVLSFASGREFAAFLGLAPRQRPIAAAGGRHCFLSAEAWHNWLRASSRLWARAHASGRAAEKERLGRLTKMGDRYLRKLLVVGATTVLHHAIGDDDSLRRWARQTLERKGRRAGSS